MTKVYCFLTTMFQCKLVIAQMPRRSPLEIGYILMYVHTNCMSSLKHISVRMTNQLGSQLLVTCNYPYILILVRLQVTLPPIVHMV